MRYFKIKCLSVSTNNRVLRDNEVHPESVFGKELADKYLEQGKIAEVKKTGKEKKSEPAAYEDVTVKELQAKLKDIDVEFDEKANKKDLYQLYSDNFPS